MKYLLSLVFILALAPLAQAASQTAGTVPAGGICNPPDTPSDCMTGYICSFTLDICVSANSNPDQFPPSGAGTGQPTTGTGGGASGQPTTGNGSLNGSNSGSGNATCLTNPLSVGGNGCDANSSVTIPQFVADILKFVVQIGTVVVILMLVYIGFLFVTAQGEPGKISEARQALLYTIIGALILLGAQVIASGIQATVNALSTGP